MQFIIAKKIRSTTLLFLILVTNSLVAQKKPGYTITGRITGLKDGEKATLVSFDRDEILDSTFVKNHEFKFKGRLFDSPELLSIRFPNTQNATIQILLGNENLVIEGDINSSKYKFAGSTYQAGWHKLNLLESSFYSKIDSLNRLEGELNTKLRRQYFDNLDQAVIRYIKNNPKSYESLIRLRDLSAYMPKDTLKALYNKLPPNHQKSKYGRDIYNYLNALHVGDHFLDFTALASDGAIKKLSDVTTNKFTLLVFGAAWCRPCKLSRPELKEIYNAYKSRLEIVYYSIDIKKDSWLESIQTDALPYISFWGGSKSSLAAKYGFTSYPSSVLFDPEGKILKLDSGYSPGEYLKLVKDNLSQL